jgi:tetratricopeptide (TPR) repeat protein/mono/diheme cytochrome c family protein
MLSSAMSAKISVKSFYASVGLTAIATFALLARAEFRPATPQNHSVQDQSVQDQSVHSTLTFNKDIAPILFNNCAVCHHPGGSGPFSVLNYSDVQKHARQIAAVTLSHYMPPWLPEPGHGKFVGERKLDDEQIQSIQRWVASGAPEGIASDLPPTPKFSEGWQMGTPDLVIELPQPYVLLAHGNTDSWPRFVLPVPDIGTHYVRGIEIQPGNARIVHHCYVAIDRTQTLHIANGEVYEVGSTAMDGQFSSGNSELDSRFLTWRPGSPPYLEPEGMTWRLDKDTDLILIMHLLGSGKPETIRPKIGLYFSDKPPTKFPMILRLEHDEDIDIPAGAKDFQIADDLELPTDVNVLALLPHAHYLCQEMQAYATLPDGSRKWLISIKRWDFDWQGVFRYQEPLFLPKGTTLSMRYTYDNSSDNPRNPNTPPKRVVGGQRSTDEMADLWMEVLPSRRQDLAALEIAMMRHRLAKYPQDVNGYADLGAALHAMGKNNEAIAPLRQAALLNSANVQVQNNLGTVLGSLGDFEEAISHFREALKLRPDYFLACFNLANALRLQGELGEATTYYERAVELKPENVEAHDRLGSMYAQQGKLSESMAQFREALRIKPDDGLARESLARAEAAAGRVN